MSKETKQLVRRLRKLGVTVEQRRRGHLVAHTAQGPVFMPLTPSDARSIRNTVADLRRKGVDL